MQNLPFSGNLQVIIRGVLAVFYFSRVIALIDESGLIIWRDENYPLFLTEYLIECPAPQYRWN